MTIFRICIICIVIFFSAATAKSQSKSWAEKLAETVMKKWPDSLNENPVRSAKWTYSQGVVLEGIAGVWKRTGEGKYFDYIQKSMDFFVQEDGTIRRYDLDDYNIDNIKNGKLILLLYKVTGKAKYLKAATSLREQLNTHPRNPDGGFWHKKVYTNQMWLDGLYMAEPFYAEYATLLNDRSAFDDVAKQFILMEKHARDSKTGLLYHGYDDSKQERWANKVTGRSANFWARAVGWYIVALVDVLDYFPVDHPKRDSLLAILNRTATAIQKFQDPSSGLWYQVMDKASAAGNYTEASASCLFVYALTKGVRQGLLPQSYFKTATKGYDGILKKFIETDVHGQVNLTGTVSVAGLGSKPYRDGSYEYYLREKVVTNDIKGIGAFMMADNEMFLASIPKIGNSKKITLDYFFNKEVTQDGLGRTIPFHYKWEEMQNGEFSLLGEIARSYGLKTANLATAPTKENLKGTDIYVIVDPDTEKESKSPNYILPDHIKAITDWVNAGGVLVLMGNDSANVEFEHFNQLAAIFGIKFNGDSKNRVVGKSFNVGKVMIPASHPIFKTARQLYIKELSTITVTQPAKSALENKGSVIMATAKLGKGTVFAIGDPWIYNEYLDGRKLPVDYENFKAANDLIKWLIEQSGVKSSTQK